MPIDAGKFRQTLGRWASGVTIISCDHPDSSGSTERRGMTASAFISVSLEPPLILVSVGKKAQMYAALLEVDTFGVSILARDQEHLSNHFAGRPGETPIPWLELEGVPVLSGAAAALACRKVNEVDAGDHTLFVGEVLDSELSESAPLLYFSGKYGDFS